MNILAALLLAGGLDAPIMEPSVTPPVERHYCPNTRIPVKPGHEVLCPESKPEREKKPQPPTECTDASQWVPGVRYATQTKVCS